MTDRIAGVWGAYSDRLESDPIRTKALTSFMGFVVGDTLAQRIGGDPLDLFRYCRVLGLLFVSCSSVPAASAIVVGLEAVGRQLLHKEARQQAAIGAMSQLLKYLSRAQVPSARCLRSLPRRAHRPLVSPSEYAPLPSLSSCGTLAAMLLPVPAQQLVVCASFPSCDDRVVAVRQNTDIHTPDLRPDQCLDVSVHEPIFDLYQHSVNSL